MKLLFLCLIYSLVASASWINRLQMLWEEHKVQHRHKWNATEEFGRFKCFAKNVELMEAFNAEKDDGAKYALNKFAHLCHDEFSRFYTGLLTPLNRTHNPITMDPQEALRLSQEPVDWRERGAVTHVKDQGQCGSCWAFSAVGNMEGLNFLYTGALVELSEEELVQCSKSTGNEGCGGGLMDYAFDWVVENGGIAPESDYPYTSGKGTAGKCQTEKQKDFAAKFSGHVDLPHDEVQMAAWVAKNGPLSISVDAGPKWQMYHSGIKTSCFAGHPNHGVLIVGFGEEAGKPYWIVKNSWGTQWGEDGYIRIKRGANCNSIRSNPSSAKI
eukprot:GGOE01055296.1.p1 GENE.GGOE01055296.1~~GGOE01055296.1.p1  ORF type:complete len:327 (+),score=102.75 GGOE01055296.1:1060-2040(+)